MKFLLLGLIGSIALATRQMPNPPSFTPSLEVHITRSRDDGQVNTAVETRRYWAVYGFGLKQIVSLAWRVRYNRVFANPEVESNGLYDFVLVPPNELTEEEKFKLVRAAVEQHFRVRIVKEKRSIQVGILSAALGKGLALRELPEEKTPEGMGRVAGSGLGGTDRELSGHNVAMDELCDLIERFEKTLVLDETNLKGRYSIHVKGDGDFHKMLKEQLGLVVMRGQRDVDVLSIERR